MSNHLTVYSASWCGNCEPFKKQLDALGIKYKVTDLDSDEGIVEAQQYNIRSLPAVVIKSKEGDVLLIDSGTGSINKIKSLMLT